jgi:hypothetical protein
MAKSEDERRGDVEAGRRETNATSAVGRREMMKLAAGAVIAPALPQTGQKNSRRPAKA